jgi:hypothetical protein
MSLTWPKVFLFTLIPFGQIYSRVEYLNNSTDKKWLLFPLLLLPPLQIVAMLAMKLGYVKPGSGGKPYDIYMLIPIIMKFLIPFLSDRFDFPYWFIIDVLLTWISLFLPYFLSSYTKCENINLSSTTKAMSKAVILQAYIDVMSLIVSYIPFIGIFFDLAESIPLIGENSVWILIYISGYILSNILFIDNDKSNYCNNNDIRTTMVILAIVSLLGAKSIGEFL